MRDEVPISDEAIKAAMGIVLREVARPSAETWEDTIRDAIQAFLAAEGFEVEERPAETLTTYPVTQVPAQTRLSSPWRPA